MNKYKVYNFLKLISLVNFFYISLNSLNPLNAPFSTSGNQIVNSQGQTVRIMGVNWFGFESETMVPHGLWIRNYKDMMDQIKSLGFNTIRLTFNNQMFDSSSRPNSINYSQNPDLVNLTPIQILDKIVDYAEQIGIYIFLDHHRSDQGAGPNDNGLWYTSAYPESRFISDWQMLAKRYLNRPNIIGADLHNEPHGSATWGTGNASTDWSLAAQKAGNAILSVNSKWLIIVEGIEAYNDNYYWWGGNLMGVKNAPVTLNVSNKVVYSPHDYPNSVWAQPWFSVSNFPNNLPSVFKNNWGYIFEQNIAPIIIGEFGSRLQDPKDTSWISKLTSYMNGDFLATGNCTIPSTSQGISWTVWSLNPNSSDTGGILNDDWTTVRQNIMTAIKPIMKNNPCSSGTQVPVAPVLNSITVSPSSRNYTISWNNVSNATSYTLQQSANSNFSNSTIVFQGNALSYNVTNQPNGIYYYRVIALNSAGNSPFSNTQNVTINVQTPVPSAPYLNAIVVNSSTPKNYTVSWNAVANATSYTLQESTSSNFTNPTVIAKSNTTSYSVVNKSNGTYYYRVFASNGGGNSSFSNTQNITINAQNPIPSTPVLNQIILSSPTSNNYTVSWNSSTNALSYLLQQSTSADFSNPTTVAQGNITSYSFTNQVNGTYYYRVSASNANGTSKYSNIQNVTINTTVPSGSCFIDYKMSNQWDTGFIGNVVIRNSGKQAINKWQLEFSFSGNQRIVNIWNGKLSVANGSKIMISNESWNENIPAGGSVSVGFEVADNGKNRNISSFSLNGLSCSK